MRKIQLQEMSVSQLVERFIAIALEQDRALLMAESAKFNQLFGLMETVKAELRSRESDQRSALIPLQNHTNAQVRLKAAIAILAIAPSAARQTLETISERDEYPQAAYAQDMLHAIDTGSIVPV